MPKILSQAGNSLADIYDVKGSIAGVESLETRDLPIVHEMGATVFSERYATTFRRSVSGNIAQSTAFDLAITNLPATPTRLLGIAVVSDDGSRIARAVCVVHDPDANQDIPIWAFNGNLITIDMIDDNAARAAFSLLRGERDATFIPTMIGGNGQSNQDMVDQIALRGDTSAFGAGTVFVRVLYYFAFAFQGGVSSRGLPIPSW